MSVHLSVCLSVQAITFELLHIGTSFLVQRSSSSIKVIGSSSRSCAKKYDHLLISTCYSFCMWLQVINKVKVTHQDHINVKVNSKVIF